jgi:hypothetical protein
MTSRWAIYAMSISCCVVMRVFMLRGTLSRDFREQILPTATVMGRGKDVSVK